jgi:peptidyl-dipeptidase A
MTPETLVDDCAARLQPLEVALNTAWWAVNTDANDDNARRRADAEVAWSDALADADAFTAIRDARRTNGVDPLVARQLEVLEQAYTPHQLAPDLRRRIIDLQSDIEARFARFRGSIDSEEVDDNAILEILRTSTDVARRRAAWEASKLVGVEVAPDIVTLVELRNEAAHALGYRDHFALTLATTDYDEQRLFATLAEVDAITGAPFRAWKRGLDEQLASRYGIAVDAVRPWHYDDPFFQEVPQAAGVNLDPVLEGADLEGVTAETFAGIGLDVRGLLAHSDLRPRPGKVQHAFCIDVDREGDVRVLTNNVPGAFWTDTMLHEFGHATHFDGIDRALPWLLRTTHMNTTEGVAMRCGRLVRQPDWLQNVAGVPAATVQELAPRLAAARRASLLVFARWVLVMTHFELGLYADPGAAHDDRWWELVERFQLVSPPDGRHAPDWAAKIHIAVAPVYYHNYLYGELTASALTEAFGMLVDDRESGRALHERVFAPGASLRWDHLIERATGTPFGAAHLARDLA